MPVLGPVMGRAEKELLCFEPKLIKNPRKSASTKKKGFNPPIETGTGLGTPCARASLEEGLRSLHFQPSQQSNKD